MKNLKLIALLVIPTLFLTSCNNDDTAAVEEELFTTVTTTLVGGGQTITLTSRDLDADGPNAPIITVSGNLVAGTTYQGSTILLDETKNPPKDMTEEVEELGNEHQLFYQLPSVLGSITYDASNVDSDGNPIGLKFTLVAGGTGNGNLTVTLRHLPNKTASGVADGDITNAGGSSDIAVSFPIVVN